MVWAISPADPLGNVASGAVGPGSGSNGLFSGDGTRLIGYGIRTANESPEYWTSLDGTHWTRLVLTGDSTATEPTPGGVTPFLLRNGVLFVGDKESWFGHSAEVGARTARARRRRPQPRGPLPPHRAATRRAAARRHATPRATTRSRPPAPLRYTGFRSSPVPQEDRRGRTSN